MKSNKKKNSIRNAFWGVLQKLCSIILPFVIRTVIIYKMGMEYVGLNSLFTSILNVLSLTELGLGSVLIYSMYKPIADDDYDLIGRLLSFYSKIYKCIFVIILVLGLAILPLLPFFVKSDVPSDINIYIIYLIYLFNTCISYLLFAYRSSLLNGYQRNDVISCIGLITSMFMYLLQILSLYLIGNYYVYLSVLPIMTIVNNLLLFYITNRMYPEIKVNGKISKSEQKEIFNKVKSLIGHKIGSTIIVSSDNIVVSSLLGLTIVGIYNNYHYILWSIITIINIFTTSVLGAVGNSLVTKSKDDNYKIFSNLNFAFLWLVSWCSLTFIVLCQDFMRIWVGEENSFSLLTSVLFGIEIFFWQFRIILLTYKDASGLWKEDAVKPYLGAVINLGLNFLLGYFLGVNGIIISTIVTMVVIYFPMEVYVIFKYLFPSKKPYEYLLTCLKFTIMTIIVTIGTWYICSFLDKSIIGFIEEMIICLILPNIIFVLVNFYRSEFKYYINLLINKFFHKNKIN